MTMATREQVRAMTTAQPFRPYAIKLAGGASFEVRHPENVACSVNGEEMTVYDEQGMHLVDMMRVEVLGPLSTSPPKTNTKGRRK
jgi:hypothetical protein